MAARPSRRTSRLSPARSVPLSGPTRASVDCFVDTTAAARECLENVLEVQPQAFGGIRRLYVDTVGDIRAYELDNVVYMLDESIPSSEYRRAMRTGGASPMQSTIPLAPPPPPMSRAPPPPPPPMPALQEMFDESPRADTSRQLLRPDMLQAGLAQLRRAEPIKRTTSRDEFLSELRTGRTRLREADLSEQPEVRRAPPTARDELMSALRAGVQLRRTSPVSRRRPGDVADPIRDAISTRRGLISEMMDDDDDDDDEWE